MFRCESIAIHESITMLCQIHVILNAVLFCLLAEAQVDNSDNQARILILGAGASGLQAARTLHDAGMDDFIIVEAADRIGGRVRSTQFAGYTVPMGGSYVSPGSPAYKIVQELNLTRHPADYDSWTVRNQTGHNVTDEANTNYERLDKGIDKLNRLSARLKENDDLPDMSQRSALRIGEWIPHSAVDKAIEWFDFDFEYGEIPEVSSVRAADTQISGQEEYITDNRGFELIFDELAGFLKKPEYTNHIRLNKKVLSVDYQNDISVVVTCEDGTRYIGEYVLVTFSLGVLQNNLIEFLPPLPEWKDVEIQKFQMSGYSIIYVSFPSKFWDDTEWILYASDRKGYYPTILNFQAQGLFPNGTPVMVFYLTGDEARRVEAEPPDTTKAEIQQVLRNMYGDSIPEATDILVSDWSQNPLTKGSFTNAPPEVPPRCQRKLQSRVDRVFFGGEATSEVFFGFITGALEAGEREAQKMLQCMEDFEVCPMFGGEGLECEPALSASSMPVMNASLLGLLSLFVTLIYV